MVPGTSDQCQRLLLRSARYNDLISIKKLVCIVAQNNGLSCVADPLKYMIKQISTFGSTPFPRKPSILNE